MRGTYLTVAIWSLLCAATAFAAPARVYVVPATVEARETPDIAGKVVGTLACGDEVSVRESSGTWRRVVSTGLRSPGWVPTWTIGPSDPEEPAPESAVTRTGDVNIRTTASESAELLAVLSEKAGVTILERRGEWCKVRIAGSKLVGWAPAWSLKPGEAKAATTGAPEITKAPDFGATRYVTAEGLNLRGAPSVEADAIAILGRNTIVYPMEVAGEWVKVRVHDGPMGWVCRVYLAATPDGVSGGPATIGAVPEARGEIRQRRDVLHDNEGMTYQDAVNVRSGPGDGFAVVAMMPAGVIFRIIGQSSGWYNAVFPDGTAGWVASWLCLANDMPEDKPPDITIEGPQPQPAARPTGPAPNAIGNAIAQYARTQFGKPYIWGAESPSVGFDCSGLVWWAHRMTGISVPRVSFDQYRFGVPVPVDQMIPGDTVFFMNTYTSGASHCGIYLGNGWFIHAPGTGKRIRIQPLIERARDFGGARRLYVRR